MNSPQFTLTSKFTNPFVPQKLPAICNLTQIGFHKYKSRWLKRLCKKFGRAAFDISYHRLGLGGKGRAILQLPTGHVPLTFNARHLHFGAIYMAHYRDAYESEVSSLLSILLKGEKIFYDIGSNWGYFSFLAASLPNYNGQIHAFEPSPNTFLDLEDMVSQAKLDSRIKCHPRALSDKVGNATMYVDSFSSGLDRILTQDIISGGNKRVTIPLITIDNFDENFADVIKIDVEGHEYQVLKGGRKKIQNKKPFIIMENWYDRDEKHTSLKPLQLLSQLDYTLFYPTWLIDGDPVPFDNHAYQKLSYAACKQIRYTSFEPSDRCKLPDQVNIFACPRNQVEQILVQFKLVP